MAVCCFCKSYGQQYRFNHNENLPDIYKFILANHDSITVYTELTEVTVVLDFNEYGVLSNTRYYKGYDDDYTGSVFSSGNKINVWPALDGYIRSFYPFLNVSDYDEEYSDIYRFTFTLVLDKAKITKGMNAILEKPRLDQKKMEKYHQDYAKQDVIPNADFTLSIKKLEIDDTKYPKKVITGKLEYLDSGSIQLAPGQFLIFRVLKSSEQGHPKTYMEYKLFSLKNDGTAFLYTKQNYLDVTERKVLISTFGNRFDSGDKEITLDRIDYDTTDRTSNINDFEYNGNFDVEIEITFK